MIDRSHFRYIDWVLVSLLLVNSLVGVIFIYSSSHYLAGDFYIKQLFFILVSLVAMFLMLSFDYNKLVTYSYYMYFSLIFILFGMLLFGVIIAGTRSWIRLPIFQIQPSELLKIVFVLVLAHVFEEFKRNYLSWEKGIFAIILVFIPVCLVSLQPDLGTALSYIPILFAAFILAGLNKRTLIFFLIIALILGIVGWTVLMKDYQKKRLTTLVFPGQDPLGAGYHVQQSKIAIGSGGLLGKGFKKGTQSQLKFLPARHTDFIFSVIGEEFGFIGIVVSVVLYFLFVSRLFQSVIKARDRAGTYIIFIISVMIASQFFINVLMTVGLFPIAGIPLPLYSYGGSSLLTNYLAVGLVINVKMRRFVYV